MWEEDKWNVHSSGYGSHGSSESGKGADYKHEQYGSKTEKDGYKPNEAYHKAEEEKKEEESKEPSIEDAIKEETKVKTEDMEQEAFKTAAQEAFHEFKDDAKTLNTKDKKNKNKSIEDAINKAIKQEKETIIVDQ